MFQDRTKAVLLCPGTVPVPVMVLSLITVQGISQHPHPTEKVKNVIYKSVINTNPEH